MQLLLATSNLGKFRELTTALAELSTVRLKSLKDLPQAVSEPAETGQAFAENARIKAEYWCQQTGLPTLADDSGILVDALPGKLGVQTVRFGLGKDATDQAWLDYFLDQLKDTPAEKRKAKFVCVLALAQPNRQTEFFEGSVRGEITTVPEAPILPGIPLSSVFRPTGSDQVFAAMTAAEKEQHSHRGLALTKMKKFLKNLI